jgi:ADP-heptose:LPS heptosyltransferase
LKYTSGLLSRGEVTLAKFAVAKFKIAPSPVNEVREFSWLFSKEIKLRRQAHCVERHFKVAKYLDCPGEINYAIVIPKRSFKDVRRKLLKENVNLKKVSVFNPDSDRFQENGVFISLSFLL